MKEQKLQDDFYDDIPSMVIEILEEMKKKYRQEDRFYKAREEYRQHVLSTKMLEVKIPSFIFNKYIT